MGYTGPDGVSCTACVAGKFKPSAGPAPCTACARGKFSATEAAVDVSTCGDCAADTYNNSGNTACLPCPTDASAPAATSGMPTDCKCNAGYSGPDGVFCTACEAGKFKPANGSAPCTQCKAGKASPAMAAVGVSACVDCAADTYSNSRMTNCLPCLAHSSSAPQSGNNRPAPSHAKAPRRERAPEQLSVGPEPPDKTPGPFGASAGADRMCSRAGNRAAGAASSSSSSAPWGLARPTGQAPRSLLTPLRHCDSAVNPPPAPVTFCGSHAPGHGFPTFGGPVPVGP